MAVATRGYNKDGTRRKKPGPKKGKRKTGTKKRKTSTKKRRTSTYRRGTAAGYFKRYPRRRVFHSLGVKRGNAYNPITGYADYATAIGPMKRPAGYVDPDSISSAWSALGGAPL